MPPCALPSWARPCWPGRRAGWHPSSSSPSSKTMGSPVLSHARATCFRLPASVSECVATSTFFLVSNLRKNRLVRVTIDLGGHERLALPTSSRRSSGDDGHFAWCLTLSWGTAHTGHATGSVARGGVLGRIGPVLGCDSAITADDDRGGQVVGCDGDLEGRANLIKYI